MNVVETTHIWLLIGTSFASLTRSKSREADRKQFTGCYTVVSCHRCYNIIPTMFNRRAIKHTISLYSKYLIISTWVPRNNKQIRTESTYYSKYLIFTVSTQLILLYKRHSEKLIFTFYQIYRNMIVLTIAFRLWAKLNSVWFISNRKLSARSYYFLIER